MGAKALKYLEEKRLRLKFQMVGMDKLIDEMAPSVKSELRKILAKLGVH